MNLVAGIDVGSTTTKVVLMEDNRIAAHKVVPTGSNCKHTAEAVSYTHLTLPTKA